MTSLEPRDEEESEKIRLAFQIGMGLRRLAGKKRGRPKGSKFLGDINRSRCLAVDAVRGILLEAGEENIHQFTDKDIVEIVRGAKDSGWEDPSEGLIFELLCSSSFDTVITSVRAGRAKIKRMKKV